MLKIPAFGNTQNVGRKKTSNQQHHQIMTEEENDNIDFTKLISGIATFLLCVGILSQMVYYSFFNISITEYLTIKEILLLFTRDIVRYFIIFLVIVIIAIIGLFLDSPNNLPRWQTLRFQANYYNQKTFKGRFIIYAGKYWISMLLLSIGLFTQYYLSKHKVPYANFVLTLVLIDITYVIYRIFLLEHKRNLKLEGKLKKSDSTIESVITFAIHFIYIIIIWSVIDAENVKHKFKYENVSFKLNNDSIINSDSLKFYIGQTEGFLFYYDKRIDVATVYNKSDIKNIFFGQIHFFGKVEHKQTKKDKKVITYIPHIDSIP